jgi:hypothetical protein
MNLHLYNFDLWQQQHQALLAAAQQRHLIYQFQQAHRARSRATRSFRLHHLVITLSFLPTRRGSYEPC